MEQDARGGDKPASWTQSLENLSRKLSSPLDGVAAHVDSLFNAVGNSLRTGLELSYSHVQQHWSSRCKKKRRSTFESGHDLSQQKRPRIVHQGRLDSAAEQCPPGNSFQAHSEFENQDAGHSPKKAGVSTDSAIFANRRPTSSKNTNLNAADHSSGFVRNSQSRTTISLTNGSVPGSMRPTTLFKSTKDSIRPSKSASMIFDSEQSGVPSQASSFELRSAETRTISAPSQNFQAISNGLHQPATQVYHHHYHYYGYQPYPYVPQIKKPHLPTTKETRNPSPTPGGQGLTVLTSPLGKAYSAQLNSARKPTGRFCTEEEIAVAEHANSHVEKMSKGWSIFDDVMKERARLVQATAAATRGRDVPGCGWYTSYPSPWGPPKVQPAAINYPTRYGASRSRWEYQTPSPWHHAGFRGRDSPAQRRSPDNQTQAGMDRKPAEPDVDEEDFAQQRRSNPQERGNAFSPTHGEAELPEPDESDSCQMDVQQHSPEVVDIDSVFDVSPEEKVDDESVMTDKSDKTQNDDPDDDGNIVVSDDDDLFRGALADRFSEAEQAKISRALDRNAPMDEVLGRIGRTAVTREKIQCMRDGVWLNDEVINFCMERIMLRSKKSGLEPGARAVDSKGKGMCHCFNTFFYAKLTEGDESYNYRNVKRWTRRVDLAAVHSAVVPVHLPGHWALAAILFDEKQIVYYDSMNRNGGKGSDVLDTLRRYLVDEWRDKKEATFDMQAWENKISKDAPQQHNNCDCGVFAIKFAEHVSSNKQMDFAQTDFPRFRRELVLSILEHVPEN